MLLFRDADAGIADEDPQAYLAAVGGPGLFDAHIDVAALGELDGVAGEVGQHLLQAHGVAGEVVRHGGVHLQGELELFVVGTRPQQVHGFVEGVSQAERYMLELQLARLQLGEVEDVVDDAEQVARRLLYGLHVVGLTRCQAGFEQLAGEADDAVERGAQLVGHVGQKLGFDPCRLLRPFLRHVELDVLDLYLFKRLSQIRGRLIDVLLHLLMVFGERLGHGVDAVLQHVQLAGELTADPGIEAPLPDPVHRLHHIGDGLGHALDQTEAEQGTDGEADEHYDHREEGVAILQDYGPVGGELHGDVADDRRLQVARQGEAVQAGLGLDGGAQYDVIAVEGDAGQGRDGAAVRQAQLAEVPVVVGGDEQLVVLGEDGDGLDEGGVLAMGQPDQPLERLTAVLGHAVFTGDGQGLYDVDALIDQVVFQLMVAVEGKVTGDQAADDQGWQYGKCQYTGSEAVLGHADKPPANMMKTIAPGACGRRGRAGNTVDVTVRALRPYPVISMGHLWSDWAMGQRPQLGPSGRIWSYYYSCGTMACCRFHNHDIATYRHQVLWPSFSSPKRNPPSPNVLNLR